MYDDADGRYYSKKNTAKHIPAQLSKSTAKDDRTKRERIRSIRVMYFVSFSLCVEYGVVIATVWPYLRKVHPNVTTLFLGITAASYSSGHLLFSFLFGQWVDKRNAIEPLVFSLVTIIVGCIIYAYAETVAGSAGAYMILLSRSVTGLVAGADVALRTFVSKVTRPEEKTNIFGNLAMFGVLGFIAGPALQIVLSFLRDHDLKIDVLNIHISIYTAPALIGILLSALSLMALWLWFKEVRVEDFHHSEKNGYSIPPDPVAIATNMVLVITYQFCYTSFEGLLSPILIDEFSLDNKDAIFYASIVFFSGLIIVLFGFDAAKRLIDRFGVPSTVTCGCILMLLAFVAILPWGNDLPTQQKIFVIVSGNASKEFLSAGCSRTHSWCTTTPRITIFQLVLYSMLISIAFSLMYLSQYVMLYEILSPKKQGFYMAIVTCCGSASRIFGPLITTYFYGRFGPRWTFLLIDSFLVVVLFIIYLTYNHIVPYEEYIRKVYMLH